MIVLDTNVVAETFRPRPDAAVLGWLDRWPTTDVHLTSVTVGELMFGVARLAQGRRRDAIADRLAAVLDGAFAGRILPYDAAAARWFGVIAAARERRGTPIGAADAQIAAVCAARGATLATRNVRDFLDTGVELVDPWRLDSAAPPA